MKPGYLVAAALWLSASMALSQAVDKNKPHGRACISVLNSANGDEEALRADSEAGRGRKVQAHLEATAKCEALVAIFTKSGQPVPGWAPQFVDVSARKEVLLPKAPAMWNWEKATGPLEAYVLFFAPGSNDGAELRALVGAMQKMNDSGVTKLQTNKLRELIGRAKIDRAAAERAAPPDAEVAGTFRMVVGFEWRDSARAANFSSGRPGALIFPAVH
jgi:hypothetical protein